MSTAARAVMKTPRPIAMQDFSIMVGPTAAPRQIKQVAETGNKSEAYVLFQQYVQQQSGTRTTVVLHQRSESRVLQFMDCSTRPVNYRGERIVYSC